MKFLLLYALLLGSFPVTSYRSTPAQTKPKGCVWTASGVRCNVHGVAVSQDMLKINGGKLKFGDALLIEGIGIKFVEDTMNKRHTQRLDIWVSTLKEEKAFDIKFRDKKLKVWLIRLPIQEK